jgi:probable HAF family extracellular repeat protein
MRRTLSAVALVVLLAAPADAATAAQRYHLTDLGTLGGPSSDAHAINDAGEVVGAADLTGARSHAFWWILGDLRIHDLGTLGGPNSEANAVNSGGVIAGEADVADGTPRGFRGPPGALQSLGTTGVCPISNPPFSSAVGINDAGYAVGASALPCGSDGRSVIAPPGLLFGPTAGRNTYASDINDLGQIALDGGVYEYPPLIEQPDGSVTDVPSPAEHVYALNDRGHATGSTHPLAPTFDRHAYLFNGNTGEILDLGQLGSGHTDGLAVNERDDVVGTSGAGAFVSLQGTPLQPLSDLLDHDSRAWSPTTAEGINLSGVIVGQGEIGGQTHAFVAQPVADLRVTLEEPSGPILAGDHFFLEGTVTNRGPSEVGDVHLSFHTSRAATFVAQVPGSDCFTAPQDSGCNLHLMQPGESRGLFLVLKVDDRGRLTLTGALQDQAYDTQPRNDDARVRVRIR